MQATLIRWAKTSYQSAPSAKHTFKRAQKGLFGGKVKQFGNNVPDSHQKTRRTWSPNVQNKRLFSSTLNEMIKIKVTTSALRDIDKVGGLDQYLLKRSFEKDLGDTGKRLKMRVLETLKMRESGSSLKQQDREHQLHSRARNAARSLLGVEAPMLDSPAGQQQQQTTSS